MTQIHYGEAQLAQLNHPESTHLDRKRVSIQYEREKWERDIKQQEALLRRLRRENEQLQYMCERYKVFRIQHTYILYLHYLSCGF